MKIITLLIFLLGCYIFWRIIKYIVFSTEYKPEDYKKCCCRKCQKKKKYIIFEEPYNTRQVIVYKYISKDWRD